MEEADFVIHVFVVYQGVVLISRAWMKRNDNLVEELVHNTETFLIDVVFRVPKLRHRNQLVKRIHHLAKKVVDIDMFVIKEVLNGLEILNKVTLLREESI